jgi:small subunit ribosomal protein S9
MPPTISPSKQAPHPTRYVEAVGRRKTAVAVARLTSASKILYTINGKELSAYFPTEELSATVRAPLAEAPNVKCTVSVRVSGGGISAQASAIRHAIARALLSYQADMRPTLKKAGFLKRDPRAKERRKFGLKKARKAPQWSKR